MDNSAVNRGAQWSVQVPLTDPSGLPYDDYAQTVPLDCAITGGPDNAANLPVAAAWDGTLPGVINLYLAPFLTETLKPGYYRVALRVDDPTGGWREVESLILEVKDAANDPNPPVYCSYQNLVDLGAGWLTTVPVKRDLTSGFIRQRGLARAWLDDVLVAHAPTCRGYSGVGGWSSTSIRTALGLGGLILDEQVTRVAAVKSLACAAESQVGPVTDEGKSPFGTLAAEWHRRADREVRSLVAGVVLDPNRLPVDQANPPTVAIRIDCGVSFLR